jgi:uncharacterized protein YbcC (UPF0753/DUF2309 family)
LRLNVFIDAPIDALDRTIQKHPPVQALVDNQWVHLFALASDGGATQRYLGAGHWAPVP